MTENQTLLIVEDEKRIAALLADYARSEGFRPIVLNRGDHALSIVRNAPPSLILLDIMLPGMDGLSLCRQIRKENNVPIILITAKVDESDILRGLELGADDYICKPFSPREVMARIKAVLRRTGSDFSGQTFKIGEFILDSRFQDLFIHDQSLNLTPSEYGIVKLLMARPKAVFSRKELMERVQGYHYDGYNRTVDTHIKNLRKKINGLLPDRNPIVSVYGTGYKFDPDAK